MTHIHDVGKIVKWHRKQSGLSQKELATLAGVGKTVVFDLEKGKPTVQLNTLTRVLSTLNLTLEVEGPLMADYNAMRKKEFSGETS